MRKSQTFTPSKRGCASSYQLPARGWASARQVATQPRCDLFMNSRRNNHRQPIFSKEDEDLSKIYWSLGWCGYPIKELPRKDKARSIISAHRAVAARSCGFNLTPINVVDHINGDIFDNRRENLRVVTKKQNCENKHKCGEFRGTYWNKKANKWQAQVKHNYQTIYIGLFCDRKEAANAAKSKRDELGFLTSTP